MPEPSNRADGRTAAAGETGTTNAAGRTGGTGTTSTTNTTAPRIARWSRSCPGRGPARRPRRPSSSRRRAGTPGTTSAAAASSPASGSRRSPRTGACSGCTAASSACPLRGCTCGCRTSGRPSRPGSAAASAPPRTTPRPRASRPRTGGPRRRRPPPPPSARSCSSCRPAPLDALALRHRLCDGGATQISCPYARAWEPCSEKRREILDWRPCGNVAGRRRVAGGLHAQASSTLCLIASQASDALGTALEGQVCPAGSRDRGGILRLPGRRERRANYGSTARYLFTAWRRLLRRRFPLHGRQP